MDKDRTRILPPKHLIKATSSYVRYMQIETPINFKPRDQRMVRSFLKDISHINFFKEKNSENIVFLRGIFFVSMFDIGQISDLLPLSDINKTK